MELTINVLQAISEECVDLYFHGWTMHDALRHICSENNINYEEARAALERSE